MPNNRPNFYETTGYYVMTITAKWMGYPPSNGSFEIVDGVLTSYKQSQDLLEMATIPAAVKDTTPLKLESPIKVPINVPDNDEMKMNAWIFVLILIILLFTAYGFSREKKSIKKY